MINYISSTLVHHSHVRPVSVTYRHTNIHTGRT